MTSIRLSDGIVKDEILVVGLAVKAPKAAKSPSSLQIESGDIALDNKALLQTLADLGATGKADEVIKVPGTATRLIVFTGLGKQSATYDNEVLRRAAGAAARAHPVWWLCAHLWQLGRGDRCVVVFLDSRIRSCYWRASECGFGQSGDQRSAVECVIRRREWLMAGYMAGKRGLVMGLANDRSLG